MRTIHRPIVLLLIISMFASICSGFAFANEDAQTVSQIDTIFQEPVTEDVVEVTYDPAEDAATGTDTSDMSTEEILPETEEDTAPDTAIETDLIPESDTILPAESAFPALEEEQTGLEEPAAEPEAVSEDTGEDVIPTPYATSDPEYNWTTPGNTDSEILAGGTMLSSENGLYYTDMCIWLKTGDNIVCVSNDEGRNLNLAAGLLYYTLGDSVYRVPASGGSRETVYTFTSEIKQLYVIGTELRFLAAEGVYSYDMTAETLTEINSPSNVLALIPTAYGNLFLTGAAQDYTLWAENNALRNGIRNCYTDQEWLIIEIDENVWQTPLEDLFDGSCTLYDFDLYDDVVQAVLNSGLTEEQQLANEAAFLQSDAYLESLNSAPVLLALDDYLYYVSKNANISYTAGNLNQNQENIVLRGRQMAEVEWTPLKNRYSWGGNDSSYVSSNRFGSRVIPIDGDATYGYFEAGKTYRGVPYSQAVYTGYVGWNISLSDFVNAVNDTSSKFYSGYSTYSRTAPYYGSDCSGFVSWAWDLPIRCTCETLVNYSKYIGTNINSIQVGDCLNKTSSHVVLVTDIGYDSAGNIVAIEITEQTPAKMRVSCYGEQIPGKYYDSLYSMSYFKSYYLNGGYVIYRHKNIDKSGAVEFTESDAVDLNKGGYARAPKISVSVNAAGTAKVVTLSHSDSEAVIYYTTDGTTPTSGSTKYTGPFQVTKDTTIKAIAECGSKYTDSYVLTYKVTATKSEKPVLTLVDGDMHPGTSVTYVSSGTYIALFNEDMDTIYYTTDGSTPTTSSTKMPDSGIKITKNTLIKAIAAGETTLNSEVATIQIELGSFHTIEVSDSLGGIISPSGAIGVLDGADYTVAIIPDEFYEIKDVKVDGISVGVVESYTFKAVKTDHTISAVFSIDLPFTDVGDAWYTDAVHFAYSQGLVSGTTTTTFSPYDTVTRAMFATILGRYAKAGTDLENWSGRLGITNGSNINIREKTSTSDTSYVKTSTGLTGEHIHVLDKISASSSLDGGVWYKVSYKGYTGYIREKSVSTPPKTLIYVYSNSFTDLESGAYYNGYVQWGSAFSLIKGIDESTFAPYDYISRQDICVLIYRYLTEYMSFNLSSTTSTFSDDANIADYAKTAVYAMKKIGVVQGYEDGCFNPYGYATRAEIATIFTNLYHWMNS